MKYKKLYFFSAGALIAVFLFYHYADTIFLGISHKLKMPKSAVTVYNHSIKTEYGKTIKVARVIDGDTIELINGERLRYIGIDTPEEFDPRKPVQCFAKEAADANKNLVEGKSIIFYKDISDRDKYGRWLGFVYLEDGTFVNLALVRQGFAFAYPYKPDISHADDFQKTETEAHKTKRGLWTACAVHRDSNNHEQTSAL